MADGDETTPTPKPAQASSSEDRRKNGAVFKDPRIDKAVSWFFGAALTISISIVAAVMNGLDKHLTTLDTGQQALSKEMAEVKNGLDDKIGAIRVEIASIRGSQKEMEDLKASLNEVRGWVHELEKRQSDRPK